MTSVSEIRRDDDVWTVQRVIEWTAKYLREHGSETPRLDTELLLAHTRRCRRIDLYVHYSDELSASERAQMRELVLRRGRSEPVAYLIGHREFFGLDFRVTPDVLVPRPETETLVVELIERARGCCGVRILDVGTGSGCIAIAAAVNLPGAHITACDVDPAALNVAKRNAEIHAVADRVRFVQSDLFASIEPEAFDLIVSNPPYVAENELESLQADVRLYEPRRALVAGPDGLAIIKRLIDEVNPYLKCGGVLMFEISPEQAEPALKHIEAAGVFEGAKTVNDLTGRFRAVVARRTL